MASGNRITFQERRLVIATMHSKEQVIAPILENILGVKCIVPSDLDTDSFGTFTSEIERKYDPITTARKKAELAMKLTGCDLAVSSEGSFGPHPSIFLAPADDEFILFLDRQNNLEIIERELSTETNYAQKEIRTESELTQFAQSIQFPSHGIILRDSRNHNAFIEKGIKDWNKLSQVFSNIKANHTTVFAETDMRAMHNPTRMSVIKSATEKLVQKIQSICPECSTPGFGIKASQPGLPCELCGYPTKSTLRHIKKCAACHHEEAIEFPYNKKHENPMFCDLCNP